MKRNNFLKALGLLAIMPTMVKDINFTPVADNEIVFAEVCCGHTFRCNYEENEERSIASWQFNHYESKGEYNVYMKDGNKITFQVAKYEPEVWAEKYNYLSEIEY